MLKITIKPGPGEVQLKLEGELAGTWVRAFDECWRATRSYRDGGPASVDLTDVSRVDDAGRYLLVAIHKSGARMVSKGVAMRDLVESIARDWPPVNTEGPG